jgi:hypothetical protein
MTHEERWWWVQFIVKVLLALAALAIVAIVNFYATCNYAPSHLPFGIDL